MKCGAQVDRTRCGALGEQEPLGHRQSDRRATSLLCLAVVALASCVFSACSELYVYAPGPAGRLPSAEALISPVVQRTYERGPSFARHRGSIFRDTVGNAGGPIEKVIERGIRSQPERYLVPGEELRIVVKEFVLESREDWFTARCIVRLRAEIGRGAEPAESFLYEEQIESAATDTVTILSTASVLGLLWYTPYLGFRGTLVDQLDHLGRRAVRALFVKLELGRGKR